MKREFVEHLLIDCFQITASLTVVAVLDKDTGNNLWMAVLGGRAVQELPADYACKAAKMGTPARYGALSACVRQQIFNLVTLRRLEYHLAQVLEEPVMLEEYPF